VRKIALWVACGSLVASSAWGQTVNNTDLVAQSVSATITQALAGQNIGITTSQGQSILSAAQSKFTALANAIAGSGPGGWMTILRQILSDGQMFGVGASDIDYCNFNYHLDPDGHLVVPAPPMRTGGPMTRSAPGTMSPQPYGYAIRGAWASAADSQEAAALWNEHSFNLTQGSSVAYWLGYATVDPHGGYNGAPAYWFTRPSSYTGAGVKIPEASDVVTTATPYFSNSPTTYNVVGSVPCGEGVTGGNFHFYVTHPSNTSDNWSQCVMYAPTSLPGQGYAMGSTAFVPSGSMNQWPLYAPPALKACPLATSIIAALANQGLAGSGVPTVTAAQVMNGTTNPTLGDLVNDPRTGLPVVTAPTAPNAVATPMPVGATPTPATTNLNIGTVPSDPATDVSNATDPVPWSLTLPTISLGQSVTCPTNLWSFDALNHHFTMKSICDFMIGLDGSTYFRIFMRALYTLGAFTLVLSA